MNYFNIVPSDVNNIILSYLYSDELITLLFTYNLLHVNWNTVHSYHFNEYKKLSSSEYLTRLLIEELIIKLWLPHNIDEMLNIKELNLSRYNLVQVPSVVFLLNNLETLDLSDNRLTQVPKGINKLTNLRVLYLDHNYIKDLPEGIFDNLNNLKQLSLDDYLLSWIPTKIRKRPNLSIILLPKE